MSTRFLLPILLLVAPLFHPLKAHALASIELYWRANAKDCELRWKGNPSVQKVEAPDGVGYTRVSVGVTCHYVLSSGQPATYSYSGHSRRYPMTRPAVTEHQSVDKPTNQCGSIIEQEKQVLRENIPLIGTPFFLSYSSDRAHAYAADREANFSFAGAGGTFENVKVSTTLGSGPQQEASVDPDVTTNVALNWNGLDETSNYKMIAEMLVAKEEFYDHDEYGCTSFWDGTQICAGGTITPTYSIERRIPLGGLRSKALGLGGWTLSENHFYDSIAQRLHFGSGGSRSVSVSAVAEIYTVPSEDGSEVYYFDSTGRHTLTKTGLTGSTKYSFAYDSAGRLISITDAYSNVTLITRDSTGLMTGVQTPYGQINSVSLDTNGYLVEIENPADEKYEMTYYSSGGLLNTFKKPRGQISTFTYDSVGRLTSDSNSAGQGWSITRTTTGTTKTVNMTSALNRMTSAVITLNNQNSSQSTVTHPSGYSESTTISNTSYETFTGSFYSASTSYLPDKRFGDAARFPASTSYNWPSIGTSLITRDDAVTYNNPSTPEPFDINSLVRTYTQGTKVATISFSGANKKFTSTTPVGRQTFTTIDTNENPIQFQYAGFAPTDFTYDARGRLSTITQSARTTTYNYNPLGYVSSILNPANQTTSYTYDLVGRVLTQTLPDSRVIAYSYDANGNLTGITPPSSFTHTFTVNLKDLIDTYGAPSLGSGLLNTSYAYNNDKQLTQISRPNGSIITLSYHPTQGTLTSMTTNGSGTKSFSYNKGRILIAQSPDDVTTSFQYSGPALTSVQNSSKGIGKIGFIYDKNLNVTSTAIGSNAAILYEYDNDDLIKKAGSETITRSLPTGFVTATSLGSITEAFTYDSAYGELSEYDTDYGLTNLLKETYTRDALGRIETRAATIGSSSAEVYTYTYDNSGRLTVVDKNGMMLSSYTYDNNSNRTSITQSGITISGTYDSQDRLSTWGTNTYTHNLNGERIQKSDSSTDPASVTNYTWDAWGNLKSVQIPSGTTFNFKYDGLNRLTRKLTGTTINANYVYLDQVRLAAVLDATGATVILYVWGHKPNTPEYMIKGGVNYKLVTDHVGSIRMVVNSTTGAIAQEIEYDEFGRVLSDSNPGFQPLGFAGGLYDSTTGLVHFGARSYDPEVGRWLSKDPILFEGGDTNLYGYVLADPVNFVDPEGESRRPPGRINDLADNMGGPGGAGGAAAGRGGSSGWSWNPFKGKTSGQIDRIFRNKGFEPRGPNPAGGKGGYVNPKTGRSYHIDVKNRFGEPPHVDVNRPRSCDMPKRKLPMGEE